MANIVLRVNGREYGGWKSARVMRGIETVSGAFELEVSDRWASQDTPWPIAEEDECTVLIDGTTVITGYVDRRSLSYDAEGHSLGVAGRDRTGDLVDCSALLEKWEYKNISVLKFARLVAEPFGIEVSLQPGLSDSKIRIDSKDDTGKTSKLTIEPGDTAFDVIERACRLAALLPVADGKGGLLLTRTGQVRASTELVQGQNILAASAEFDVSGRYRTYFVLGQHRGTDTANAAQAAAIKAFSEDHNVRRVSRSLLIRPELNVTTSLAKRRAQWEATVRAARSDSVTVTVQGWQQASGELWPVNALVRVRSPLIGVDGDMLITQATYSADDRSGTLTQVVLSSPDAFTPEPVLTKAKTAGWKELAGGAR